MIVHSTTFRLRIYNHSSFNLNFFTFLYKSTFIFYFKIIFIFSISQIIHLYNRLLFLKGIPLLFLMIFNNIFIYLYLFLNIFLYLIELLCLIKWLLNAFSFFYFIIIFLKLFQIYLIWSQRQNIHHIFICSFIIRRNCRII
jgi:hypothetical protein